MTLILAPGAGSCDCCCCSPAPPLPALVAAVRGGSAAREEEETTLGTECGLGTGVTLLSGGGEALGGLDAEEAAVSGAVGCEGATEMEDARRRGWPFADCGFAAMGGGGPFAEEGEETAGEVGEGRRGEVGPTRWTTEVGRRGAGATMEGEDEVLKAGEGDLAAVGRGPASSSARAAEVAVVVEGDAEPYMDCGRARPAPPMAAEAGEAADVLPRRKAAAESASMVGSAWRRPLAVSEKDADVGV